MRRDIAFFWFAVLVVFMVLEEVQPETQAMYFKFNTNEHDTIGSSFSLPTPPTLNTRLTLPNGIQLTFGQIVALAGDYYGVPGSPIVNQKSPFTEDTRGRRERFMAAYGSLGLAPKNKVEPTLNKLLKMLEEDHAVTKSGRGKLHTDQEWDEATGGGWAAGIPVTFGTMMKLAEDNYDHFQPQAKHAYLVGHQLAIEKAQEAKREANPAVQTNKLMEAYSMDAFAGHFLTDCFSSGHIRTPRVELHNRVTPAKIGDLLSKFMHDEDCKYGLRVTNVRGDQWVCYGDKYLMKAGNEDNVRLAVEAIKTSAFQVHEAFVNPAKKINPSVVTDLLPYPDTTKSNNSPLFQVINGDLHRRLDVKNLQDKKTKEEEDWWGTTSAIQIFTVTKQNPAIPQAREITLE